MNYLLFTPATNQDKENFNTFVLDQYEYHADTFENGSFYLPVECGGDADNLEMQITSILEKEDINGYFEFQED